MTKYFGFHYSVTYCTAVTRTEVSLCWSNQCEIVQLLNLKPDFIAPALWQANSPDLNPVEYEGRSISNEKTCKKSTHIKIVSELFHIIFLESNTAFPSMLQRFDAFKEEILILLFNPLIDGHNNGFSSTTLSLLYSSGSDHIFQTGLSESCLAPVLRF